MKYYSIVFKLMTTQPKYFVKHCFDSKEYLEFLDHLHKDRDVETVSTIIDKTKHWKALDYLLKKINQGNIDEDFLKRELELINNKIAI